MNKRANMIPLGPALKELRLAGGLNQRQFAELLEIPRQKISQYESGYIIPGTVTLFNIAAVTNVPLSKIIKRAESKRKRCVAVADNPLTAPKTVLSCD
jgi:transcriptional regulator with XRE-family HTH domain